LLPIWTFCDPGQLTPRWLDPFPLPPVNAQPAIASRATRQTMFLRVFMQCFVQCFGESSACTDLLASLHGNRGAELQ